VALRKICGQTLLIGTATIPEIRGLPQAAVYYPYLDEAQRRFWNVPSRGLQEGLGNAFTRQAGYSPWFWGMTPSCVGALLTNAGFRVESKFVVPFGTVFECSLAPDSDP
jgi:hypothetical protein